MRKYLVKVQTTIEFFVEAKDEENSLRIVAEHYKNNSLDTVERGYTAIEIFNEDYEEFE